MACDAATAGPTTSTCWPRPESRSRSSRAISAAPAASAAAWWKAWGTLIRTGGRSSSPVSDSWPPAAHDRQVGGGPAGLRARRCRRRDRRVHQRGVGGRQHVPAEAERGERAGCRTIDQHVGAGRPVEAGAPRSVGAVEVQHHRALAPVEGPVDEATAPGRLDSPAKGPAGRTGAPARRLDGDDVRARGRPAAGRTAGRARRSGPGPDTAARCPPLRWPAPDAGHRSPRGPPPRV